MPSAAGKRVGRVLAGCSKPEAGDKPGLLTWHVILGTRSLHSQLNVRSEHLLEAKCLTTRTCYIPIRLNYTEKVTLGESEKPVNSGETEIL